MRKFRGQKLRANNEWVYGYYWYNPFTDEHFIKTLVEGGTQFEDVKVKPETVGSETTLKDKNGKEIYEGDILATINDDPKYDIWDKGDWGYTAVIWHNSTSCFCGSNWTWEDSNSESVYDLQFIEVIGNIYENSELTNKQNH